MAIIPRGRFKTTVSTQGKAIALPRSNASAPYRALAQLGGEMAQIGGELYQREKRINIRREADEATAKYKKMVAEGELKNSERLDENGNIVNDDGTKSPYHELYASHRELTAELVTDGISKEAAEQFRQNVHIYNTNKAVADITSYHKIGEYNFTKSNTDKVNTTSKDISLGSYQGLDRLDAYNDANTEITTELSKAVEDGQISELKFNSLQEQYEGVYANDALTRAAKTGNKEEVLAILMSQDPETFKAKYARMYKKELLADGVSSEDLAEFENDMNAKMADTRIAKYAKFRKHLSTKDMLSALNTVTKQASQNKNAARKDNSLRYNADSLQYVKGLKESNATIKNEALARLSENIGEFKTLGATPLDAFKNRALPITKAEFIDKFNRESISRSSLERAKYSATGLIEEAKRAVSDAEKLAGVTLSAADRNSQVHALAQEYKAGQETRDIIADNKFQQFPADFLASIYPELYDSMKKSFTAKDLHKMQNLMTERNGGVPMPNARLLPRKIVADRISRLDEWALVKDSRSIGQYISQLAIDTQGFAGKMYSEIISESKTGLGKTLLPILDFREGDRILFIDDALKMKGLASEYAARNKALDAEHRVNVQSLLLSSSESSQNRVDASADKMSVERVQARRQLILARFYALQAGAPPNKSVDKETMERAVQQVMTDNYHPVRVGNRYFNVARRHDFEKNDIQEAARFFEKTIKDNITSYSIAPSSVSAALTGAEKEEYLKDMLQGDNFQVYLKWSDDEASFIGGVKTPRGWYPLSKDNKPVKYNIDHTDELVQKSLTDKKNRAEAARVLPHTVTPPAQR